MFVAVWPDDSTRERLSALRLGPIEALRVVEPRQWHVTLRFLGDVDPGLVPVLVAALETGAGELPDSIRCEIGPTTAWFGGDRVLQVPVAGLEGAAVAVHDATVPIVSQANPGDEARFTGHLTLARSKRRRPVASERSALGGIPMTASFAVDSFDLVASLTTKNDSRYKSLERISLPGAAAASAGVEDAARIPSPRVSNTNPP